MKKKMILALAMMIGLGVNAQKKWTLDDCISYALENNITLLQAKLRKQSATEDRKQSHAALFPTLSASTNQSVGFRPWTSAGTMTVTDQFRDGAEQNDDLTMLAFRITNRQ